MVIRCSQCGATLGQQVAGLLIVSHRRRELRIDLPAHVVQRCDNCGCLNEMGNFSCTPVYAVTTTFTGHRLPDPGPATSG